MISIPLLPDCRRIRATPLGAERGRARAGRHGLFQGGGFQPPARGRTSASDSSGLRWPRTSSSCWRSGGASARARRRRVRCGHAPAAHALLLAFRPAPDDAHDPRDCRVSARSSSLRGGRTRRRRRIQILAAAALRPVRQAMSRRRRATGYRRVRSALVAPRCPVDWSRWRRRSRSGCHIPWRNRLARRKSRRRVHRLVEPAEPAARGRRMADWLPRRR